MAYTSDDLKGMKMLDLRKAAKEVGITAAKMSGKKTNELARMILTAQKPGGVDARINPKAAAAAKAEASAGGKKGGRRGGAKMTVVKAQAEPEVLEKTAGVTAADVFDKGGDVEPSVDNLPELTLGEAKMGTIIDYLRGHTAIIRALQHEVLSGRNRMTMIEKALVDNDILKAKDLAAASTTPKTATVEAIDVDTLLDDKGEFLPMTAEQIQSFPPSTLLEINELLKDYGMAHVKMTPEVEKTWLQEPRTARKELTAALLKEGVVTKARAPRKPKEEPAPVPEPEAEAEEDEGDEWVPQENEECIFIDGETGKELSAICTGPSFEAEDEETGEMLEYFPVDVDYPDDTYAVDAVYEDLKPLKNAA